jgi:hypothetical protein
LSFPTTEQQQELQPASRPSDVPLLAQCRKLWRRRVPADTRALIHWTIVNRRVVSEVVASLNPTLRSSRITTGTQLVIDGFPRSGSTYARHAFLHGNGPGVPISSHRQSARSIENAMRRGIPVIVLLRPPRAAIASFLHDEPGLQLDWAIDTNRSFHHAILPICHSILVASFDEVTHDFGQVIRRCNERYGTDFVPYEATPDAEAAVARSIDSDALRTFEFNELSRFAGRPMPARKATGDFQAQLDQRLMDKLDELEVLHDTILWKCRRAAREPSRSSR